MVKKYTGIILLGLLLLMSAFVLGQEMKVVEETKPLSQEEFIVALLSPLEEDEQRDILTSIEEAKKERFFDMIKNKIKSFRFLEE